jgi:hypothetical protein
MERKALLEEVAQRAAQRLVDAIRVEAIERAERQRPPRARIDEGVDDAGTTGCSGAADVSSCGAFAWGAGCACADA